MKSAIFRFAALVLVVAVAAALAANVVAATSRAHAPAASLPVALGACDDCAASRTAS